MFPMGVLTTYNTPFLKVSDMNAILTEAANARNRGLLRHL